HNNHGETFIDHMIDNDNMDKDLFILQERDNISDQEQDNVTDQEQDNVTDSEYEE
ncbi:22612_t:CDS:1, partial [Cetraspora pellucida]